MIIIENKRRKLERIQAEYPNAVILDITSASKLRYAQILSPFYPHYNIPIPFSEGYYATCVEAIWQGLKVFQSADVDFEMFKNDTMKNLKRTVKRFGKPLGHRKGVHGTELLDYFSARMQIYLPSYKWVLENVKEVNEVVMRIKEHSLTHDIVFLNYNTNIDFRDTSTPLSHAGLVKLFIEGNYPLETAEYHPLTSEEIQEKKDKKKQKKEDPLQLTLFK